MAGQDVGSSYRQYKGILPRFAAQIIDGTILIPIWLALTYATFVAFNAEWYAGMYRDPMRMLWSDFLAGLPSLGTILGGWQVAGDPYGNPLGWLALIYFFAIQFTYFFILEGLKGATLGKRALKMKVARDDGSPCGMRPSLIRNILRFVDFAPYILLPYAVGALFIYGGWPQKKNQRIGDIAAHTVVVDRNWTGSYSESQEEPSQH